MAAAIFRVLPELNYVPAAVTVVKLVQEGKTEVDVNTLVWAGKTMAERGQRVDAWELLTKALNITLTGTNARLDARAYEALRLAFPDEAEAEYTRQLSDLGIFTSASRVAISAEEIFGRFGSSESRIAFAWKIVVSTAKPEIIDYATRLLSLELNWPYDSLKLTLNGLSPIDWTV
jgi:hypothetical protein